MSPPRAPTRAPVRYIPGAEPFLYLRGPVGCLLVHGYTSAPAELRWLGDYLAERQVTVLAVRLTGHGTVKEDMLPATWRHWVADALDGLTVLRQLCERVYVAGFSLGGLVALYLAAHYPVDGVVSMGTALKITVPNARLGARLSRWLRYTPKRGRAGHPLEAEVRREQRVRGEPEVGRVVYDCEVLPAVANMMALGREVDAALPQVTAPVLLAHSREDRTAAPEGMVHIYERVGSADKHMLWIADGHHVITLDVHREEVFEAVWRFIYERSAAHFAQQGASQVTDAQ